MSHSTPIHNIPRDQQNFDQTRDIQNVINSNVEEMQFQQSYEPTVDQAYAQAQSQQQQFQQQQFQPQDMGMYQPQMQLQPQQPQPQMQMGQMGQMGQMPYNPQIGLNGNLYVPSQLSGQMPFNHQLMAGHDDSSSWYSSYLYEFKDSIIVAVLFVLLNINIVQHLLKLYIPYMDNAFLELFVRAIISGVLFYLIRRFWKN